MVHLHTPLHKLRLQNIIAIVGSLLIGLRRCYFLFNVVSKCLFVIGLKTVSMVCVCDGPFHFMYKPPPPLPIEGAGILGGRERGEYR